MFAAPELMRGEVYDESADVFSFAILLLAMAVEEDLPTWFQERYQATIVTSTDNDVDDNNKKKEKKRKKKPPGIMRVLRSVWEGGWRPYDAGSGASSVDEGGRDPLAFAPSTIRSLIARCKFIKKSLQLVYLSWSYLRRLIALLFG